MYPVILMHMADGLVSVPVGVIFLAVSFVILALSIRKIGSSHDESKIPMMALVGAFVFVAQMINFTIPGTGSSGHIGGGILLCLILGEYPAFLSIACVLIIQCLFFGDGGLLALGCNLFNMGVIPCFLAYPLIVKPILQRKLDSKSIALASILGAMIGLEIGAFGVVLETMASGITELPFTTFVSLMLPIHLAIGLVEGIITAAVTLYVYKESPDLIDHSLTLKKTPPISKKLLGVFIALIILVGGGLSLYASSNPDGLEWSIEKVTGSTEIEYSDSIKEGFAAVQEKLAFLPDYSFSFSDSSLGTSTSGIVGGAICIFLVGGIGYLATKKGKHE